jgi:uncharacterized protein YyaL (SSP411 family)
VIGRPDDPGTQALLTRARRMLLPEDAVIGIAPGESTPFGVDPSWLAGRVAVEGRPTAYLCHGTTCSLPVTRPEELVSALERTFQ